MRRAGQGSAHKTEPTLPLGSWHWDKLDILHGSVYVRPSSEL
jgi:hypothetical protein